MIGSLYGEGVPDVAVVLGDRVEMLRNATVAVDSGIPLLHIHGGEHTYGSLDERWRWAMTMIADRHCVATEEAYWEIGRRLVVAPDTCARITGAPGLDGILERRPVPGYPHVLVLYNPIADLSLTGREVEAIHYAVEDIAHVWFRPNGDRGSADIVRGHEWRDINELNANDFRDVLAATHVIVGNSSAGIIEAPSLGTWAVNVGERQLGRTRAANVFDVPAESEKIRAAIIDALARPRFVGVNPYNVDGRACERIRDVLLGMVALG